ncbi:MAG: NUDIX hydrolase [Anderseniella sp.]
MQQIATKSWIGQVLELFGARVQAIQVSALPCRTRNGLLEVCLVTSRDTGSWIVPKGWPEPKQSHAATAAQEAWEEAGLKGTIDPQRFGTYKALKGLKDGAKMPVRMDVYLLPDPVQHDDFPEKGQRKIIWMPVEEAISKVRDAGLAQLLKQLQKRMMS